MLNDRLQHFGFRAPDFFLRGAPFRKKPTPSLNQISNRRGRRLGSVESRGGSGSNGGTLRPTLGQRLLHQMPDDEREPGFTRWIVLGPDCYAKTKADLPVAWPQSEAGLAPIFQFMEAFDELGRRWGNHGHGRPFFGLSSK
jgi:hypothetical protein